MALPFGAMIGKLKRNRMIADVMEVRGVEGPQQQQKQQQEPSPCSCLNAASNTLSQNKP
jgi:hypothetical protein